MKKLHPYLVIPSIALAIALSIAGCTTQPAVPVALPSVPVATTGQVMPVAADAQRLVPVQGARNVRNFSQLRGKRGPIPAGAFVRAADLTQLTPADRDLLASAGVKLDLDLRTAEEMNAAPDVLAQDPRFQYKRVSLLGSERLNLDSMPNSLGEGYVQWLGTNQAQFREVLQAMAAQRGGTVLFHCTAGKDRTGMIAALLLSLAGVPRQEIVHNYALSEHYLGDALAITPQMAEMVKNNPKIAAMRGSPPEAIEAFLEELDNRYGGAEAYLKVIGLSDGEIRNLMVRLGQSH